MSWAWHEVAVLERLFPLLPGMADYKQRLRRITSASNYVLLQVVEDLSYAFSDGRQYDWSAATVEEHRQRFQAQLRTERDAFVLENEAVLLEALAQPAARATSISVSAARA